MDYSRAPTGVPEPFVLTTFSPQAAAYAGNKAANQTIPTSGAYASANTAFFYPFTITSPHTYVGMVWANGSTVNGVGNVNGAIYSADLTTALATIGSELQVGTTIPQKKAFPAPVTLPPGDYFWAICCDNATNHLMANFNVTAPMLRATGVRQLINFFALTGSAAAAVGTGTARNYLFGIYELGWL